VPFESESDDTRSFWLALANFASIDVSGVVVGCWHLESYGDLEVWLDSSSVPLARFSCAHRLHANHSQASHYCLSTGTRNTDTSCEARSRILGPVMVVSVRSTYNNAAHTGVMLAGAEPRVTSPCTTAGKKRPTSGGWEKKCACFAISLEVATLT
jgi:hypothetical protein